MLAKLQLAMGQAERHIIGGYKKNNLQKKQEEPQKLLGQRSGGRLGEYS